MRTAISGPCCHCGTLQTPCWRKGPAEKPILCNACGARWLVKNDLEGYMPGKKGCSSQSKVEKYHHPDSKTQARGVSKIKSVDGKGMKLSEETLITFYKSLGSLLFDKPNTFNQTGAPYNGRHQMEAYGQSRYESSHFAETKREAVAGFGNEVASCNSNTIQELIDDEARVHASPSKAEYYQDDTCLRLSNNFYCPVNGVDHSNHRNNYDRTDLLTAAAALASNETSDIPCNPEYPMTKKRSLIHSNLQSVSSSPDEEHASTRNDIINDKCFRDDMKNKDTSNLRSVSDDDSLLSADCYGRFFGIQSNNCKSNFNDNSIAGPSSMLIQRQHLSSSSFSPKSSYASSLCNHNAFVKSKEHINLMVKEEEDEDVEEEDNSRLSQRKRYATAASMSVPSPSVKRETIITVGGGGVINPGGNTESINVPMAIPVAVPFHQFHHTLHGTTTVHPSAVQQRGSPSLLHMDLPSNAARRPRKQARPSACSSAC
mmetsp:Transcript_18216/g.33259  ORF Transcript_18216/g.33259 Transcript_18216/m.33259 type:complete len:486 (-) Transcript_18216:376-1833(-)